MSEAKRIQQVYEEYRYTRIHLWSSTNPGNRWILQERSKAVTRLLDKYGFLPLSQKRILEVGCGSGSVLASLVELGAQPENLYGVDLLPDRIEIARQRYPGLHFICGNAEHLEFPDTYFDLVLLFTVFSSILDDGMAHNVAYEVYRVLKPGGAVLWYDFRYDNPWNPHVRGMTKQLIHQFFPNLEVHLLTITLLPPLARRLGRLTPTLYSLLVRIPLLRTHYLGLLRKS